MSEAQSAVRDYLQFLTDKESLRDDAKIAKLQKQYDAATDPIDRLHTHAELQKAKTLEVEPYEQAFVTHAKAYAEENEIPASSFVEMGVSPSVLRAAGISAGGGRRGGRRGSRVTTETVLAHMPASPFSTRQIVKSSGASIGTVRKVIEQELQAGRLKNLGPAEKWDGRGRAPNMYKRTPA